MVEPGPQVPKPDAFLPPALPYIISHIIEPLPAERMLFKFSLFQVCLDTLTIVFTFLLFQLFAKPFVSLVAALLTALSPHLIVMNTYMLTETTFTFFLVSGTLAASFAMVKSDSRLAVGAGVLLGLSGLTRATTEYLPFFMLLALYPIIDRRVFIKAVVPTALGALVIVGLWKLRNFLAIGALSDPTLAIRTVVNGIYPDLMYQGDPATLGVPYRFDPFAKSVMDMSSVLSELWQRASAEPLHYLRWYLIGKPISLLSWKMIDMSDDIFLYPINYSPYFDRPLFLGSRYLVYWLHSPLSIAAIVGFAIALIKPRLLGLADHYAYPARLMATVVVFFIVLHIVGFPLPRYGIPLRPFVYGFGVFTIACFIQAMYGRFRPSAPGNLGAKL
jgi:4-amino-4-deoxy-L-arabinose transferase-like glycosyltransferase